MIKVQKFKDLGEMKISWLHARYHFSFANYYNPNRMGFGQLLVVNDDIVRAGGGFDTHPHRDMEIITYVRKGAITHRDSEGNEGRTAAGDVQVMSAGTGVYHSEYNLESEDTSLYQIWIKPYKKGVKPSWAAVKFPKNTSEDELPLLVSGRIEDSDKDVLHINQYASIYGGKIASCKSIKHRIKNQAYILVSDGEVKINGNLLRKGDACEVVDERYIEIKTVTHSEILLIDVPE
tara:strand:- start:111542 stop:112243 length:702 start_codon:yes stop_codon:yes gene_type:complete